MSWKIRENISFLLSAFDLYHNQYPLLNNNIAGMCDYDARTAKAIRRGKPGGAGYSAGYRFCKEIEARREAAKIISKNCG